jgi:heptosyltransferase-2
VNSRVKILVRATNWIGDAVMSLPALRAIRQRYPEAEITILAKPWVADLYQDWQIIPFEGASWSLIRRLRRERFDLAILFPNSFSSAAIVWLAGVKRIVGYARDGRSLLLTDAIPTPAPLHERYYYLELLRRAGIIDSVPEVPEILFDGIAEARVRGEALFREAGVALPVVGLSPGAAFGTAKRWLPERFAEAARRLAQQMTGSVAVFGSASEKALCDEVGRAAGGRSFAGATSLRAFIDMTAACDVFLANDSGAMHIAAALGVPSVTVFGPTNEVATGPTGSRAVIVREPVECAPCGKRECPIDHRCMTRVTVDHVITALKG